jgi:hypothetical protein
MDNQQPSKATRLKISLVGKVYMHVILKDMYILTEQTNFYPHLKISADIYT